MGFDVDLSGIYSAISGQAAEIEEKIRRLRQANGEIAEEQGTGLIEIHRILKPNLADQWMGKRAQRFDEDRNEGYEEMRRILTEEYDGYQSRIENKIQALEMQLAAIRAAESLANEIGDLIDKGEEFVEEVGSKMASLKEKVFG
jgi:translation initiation factor 2 alpha subunit (eIF-2alpha)